MTAMNSDEESVIKAWQSAGRELGLDVVAPFTFVADGRKHQCLAWVGRFGRERGLVLAATAPPDFAIDLELQRDAVQEGYQWSAINVRVYAAFERNKFIEALADWGFTGPSDERPPWLPVTAS
jgi:hypothetical protein